jgi:hypothetical protein
MVMGLICLSFLVLAGTARGQSMYFEDKQSGVLFSGEFAGSKSALGIGGAVAFSLKSILDIALGTGIFNRNYSAENSSYYGGSVMFHPFRTENPHNFSLAPSFGYTYTISPNGPTKLNTFAFGFTTFCRQKISRINFIIFEAGIALVRSKSSSYGGYSYTKNVFQYNFGLDFFSKFAETTGVTVNPTISFVEEGDVVYGVNLGVLISGE